jgi:MFS family permease
MSRVSGTGRHLAVTARVVWAVLRNPALRRVELAFLLFSAALFGCYIAILVYAYEASGPGAVGVVALVLLLPAAIVAPFAASLADRYPRERVLLAGYVVQAVAYAITAAGMLSGVPPVFVYLAAAVQSAGTTLTRPAQGSLLPRLARTPEELTAANSVSGTIEGAGVLLGPLVATGVLLVAGPGAVWALGALASTVAAVLVMNVGRLLKGRRVATQPAGAVAPGHEAAVAVSAGAAAPAGAAAEDHEHTESVTSLVVGGLRALAASADTRLVVGLLAVRMVISGAMDVLFVLLAQEVFLTGQAGAGLLNAGLGLGTVLGGAASVALVGRRRMAPALGLAAITWGAAITLIGLGSPASLALALVAIGGIGFAATDVVGRTVLQRVTADRMLARVLGALEGIGLIGLAVGSVLAPILVGWLGIRGAVGVVGLLLPVVVVAAWLPLVRIDRRVRVPVREIRLLQLTPVLVPLPAPQLEAVARRTRWVAVEPGETLIREGEVGDRYYVLESGRILVTIEGRDVRILDEVGDGMGEIALLRGVRRTATLTAMTPCVLLALERTDFLEAVTGHEATHAVVRETAAGRTMGPPGRPGGSST